MSSSRRAFWVRSGLLGLVVFALLAFTLHSLRLSDASFTTGSSNTSNVFIAGTLGHSNSQSDRVMIDATGLTPGDSSAGTMRLTGTGNVAGAYELTQSSLVDAPLEPALSEYLDLTIEDTTGAAVTLWQGPASDFDSAPLGTIGPEVTRSYRITLEYPEGPNDAALQGASMTLVLRVSGVSQ